MFNKILIANRGEIAVRIIRTAREMGILTVAVFSKADKDAMHVHLADEAVCIGDSPSSASYLNMENIISAAIGKSAHAIHPGFGFLSESSKFARMCKACSIKLIGPKVSSLELLGDKAKAIELMKQHGIPVIPGSDGAVESKEQAAIIAEKIGYPVLIKAAQGGGGRGIRMARNEKELMEYYDQAITEALSCFGYGGVYVEKYLENTKHIEFQVLADNFGNIIHLGERDCSLQRRKQKIIEEAPSVAIDHRLREEMGNMAIKVARVADYDNAGTVEFLLDKNKQFYFMEMNTRIQVEHPITEMVTGVDIVKEQIRVAMNEPLSIEEAEIRGHSIECRINAENPKEYFKPSIGTIEELLIPGGIGVRFDSCLYPGYKIPPYYDSMLGKLIVWADTRDNAISKMKRALMELVVLGVDTNIEFHMELIRSKAFETGAFDTGFVDEFIMLYEN